MLGGVEGGGSKWRCAIGTSPDDLRAETVVPTTTPAETLGRVAEFFEREGPVEALGIGSFGPVDVRVGSPTWGHVTTTPKPGWAQADVAEELGRRLGVPVAFDTDVNAAAFGEHRWGACQGLDTFCYVTVGTGIGGGAMVEGSLVHGLLHPEFGHLRVPRIEGDSYEGFCPYHGDCWEGLAAAPAIEARWGRPGEELADADEVWELEARYLALGLVSVICVLSPQRIVLGGGVASTPGLHERVQRHVVGVLNGYLDADPFRAGSEGYVVEPGLGPRAGVLGAIALAEARAR